MLCRKEIIMKVQNITDIDKFFKVIDSCAGKVELVTGEGDRLNLKSKLSQYVSMANIFSDGTIAELELISDTSLPATLLSKYSTVPMPEKSNLLFYHSFFILVFHHKIN